jgi:hypothetical protein
MLYIITLFYIGKIINFSTLRFEKFIFDSGNASVENVKLSNFSQKRTIDKITYKYIMNRFKTLYIYILLLLFSIFYDVFLNKGNKYIIYDKKTDNVEITIYYIIAITLGLLIFLADYYKSDLIALLLIDITIAWVIVQVITDQLG